MALHYGPDMPETSNNLGRVFQELRQYDDAISSYERAIEQRPGYFLAVNNLGTAFAALGRHEDAIDQYRRAIELNPDYPEALGNLGVSLYVLGKNHEAIEYLAASLDLQPHSIEALSNLAQIHAHLDHHDDALKYFGIALGLAPYDASLHIGIAGVFHKAEKYSDADRHFRSAIDIDPDCAEAHAALGSVLEELGRLSEAAVCYRKAITLSPRHPAYYLNFSRMIELRLDDSLVSSMFELENEIDTLDKSAQIDLHFALGATLESIGEHERAFTHWIAGNALRRRSDTYDENGSRSSIDRIRQAFPTVSHKSDAFAQDHAIRPIFIVGMPRSGSTLVEQMLASHPKVYGAGEVSDVRDAMKYANINSRSAAYPILLGSWTNQDFNEFAQNYLNRLAARSANSGEQRLISHITDKMLGNFQHIGLLHRAIPNAVFIHTKRDPIDTCISCFSLCFRQVEYAYDLGELGRYYASYNRLMQHWHSILPTNTILDVRYEDTVDDIEAQARRILHHCGLAWDDTCLQFYRTDRPVRTASLVQVRRPIYDTSVGRWRPAQEILQPLLDGLAYHPEENWR
ncbi:MAG: sulfotransferase [Alphaproteobacteria bacterium]|nr:sulfotransferase [Alphaproteobacteria bacterium]